MLKGVSFRRLNYMKGRLICVLIALLVLANFAQGQQPNLAERVKAAIEDYRSGNADLLLALQNSPDRNKTLPYVKPYVKDHNERVRSAVVTLISGIHTPEAVDILVNMLVEEQSQLVYGIAGLLYEHYGCEEITSKTRERLRDRLISLAESGSVLLSAKPMLLLSCFKDDGQVFQFLERERKTNKSIRFDMYTPSASIAVSVDIVLTHWGRSDAVDRLLEHIEGGNFGNLDFIFQALKLVNNDRVLTKLLTLMQDTREIDRVCAHCERRYRVADLAALGFTKKLGPDVTGMNPRSLDRYSDEEIKKAYERIQAWLKARNGKWN